MSGFNSIGIIVNTIGVLAANYVKNNSTGQSSAFQTAQNQASVNSANAGQTVNSASTSATSSSYINYTAASNSYLTNSNLSNINQTIISTVEVEQRADYIKDLLGLPRDFQSLIDEIQNMNNFALNKSLSSLLVNGKINLNALTSLLADNSKDAIQKLMATIMTVSKMGSNNISQLKELMAMFSVSASSTDSSQTVKNLLMLYLPWLPLSVRNDMNLDFEIDIFDKNKEAAPDKSEGEEIIKIMIQTANYGNILATLEMTKNFEVEVFISAVENFPEKEVLKRFEKENKSYSISSRTKIEKSKDPENSPKFRQNIKVSSSGFVSPKLVQASHTLIKIIIDVDCSNFIINEEKEG